MFRVHHGLVACPGSPFPLQMPVRFCPYSLQHSTHSAVMAPLVFPPTRIFGGVLQPTHLLGFVLAPVPEAPVFCHLHQLRHQPWHPEAWPCALQAEKVSGVGASPDRTPPPEIPLCHPEASEGTHVLLHERKHGSQERTGASGLDLEAERALQSIPGLILCLF